MNNTIAEVAKVPQVCGEIDALCRVAERFESLADRLSSKLNPILREPSPVQPSVPTADGSLVPVATAIKSPRIRLRNVADVLDDLLDRIEV